MSSFIYQDLQKLLPEIFNQGSYLCVLSLYPGLNGLDGRFIIIETDDSGNGSKISKISNKTINKFGIRKHQKIKT